VLLKDLVEMLDHVAAAFLGLGWNRHADVFGLETDSERDRERRPMGRILVRCRKANWQFPSERWMKPASELVQANDWARGVAVPHTYLVAGEYGCSY
jgi:hypothetical protein